MENVTVTTLIQVSGGGCLVSVKGMATGCVTMNRPRF